MLDNYLILGNEEVEIRYVEGDLGFAHDAVAVLSRALLSVTRYFEISNPFPKVRAVIVPNRNEFDRLVRDLLRIEIEVPSNPARIAQPQRTDMVVLSPSAYESHSIFKYIPENFRRLLVHELIHMVEEYLSPDMDAIPRWWSEGLAVYLSEQWRHEDEFSKTALSGIDENKIPGFPEIEADRKSAYDWGWTIVRFVEISYGKAMILRIVKESANGDIFPVLGETASSVEKRWRNWLLNQSRLTN